MRIHIFSQTGFGVGIGSFLSSEGHSVGITIKRSLDVPQITRLVADNVPDVAIFDSNEHLVPAEWVRTRGIRVLGVSPWSNLLNTNSEYKTNVIKAIGYEQAKDDDKGTACIVSCLFNGQNFISKSLVLNYTKMMAGDVGTSVASSGYIAYFKVEESKLVKDTLEPLGKFLRKANHRGCFSVEVIVQDGGKVVIKDISADICNPFIQAVYENTRRSKSDILLDIFNESSEVIPYIEPYVCGVMISAYPYPYAIKDHITQICGVNPFNLKHMWLMDAKKDGDVWTSGILSGCIGYVTARGKDHFEAQRRAYHTIKNLSAKGLQYRVDIGKDAGEKLFELRKLKLLGG